MNKEKNVRDLRRTKVQSLQSKLSISRMYGVIMTIAFCILGIAFMNQQNNNSKQSMYYDQLAKDNNILSEKLESFSTIISELTTISEKLDEENKSLVQSNEEYYNELSELRTRKELYDNYNYALIDNSGNRTDITYDQLQTLEDLLKDSKVNDQDFILSLVMTESGGNETAKSTSSTAKGYGQFLDGTSKFVYTELLNKDGWSPSVALDGETNLEMMVAYIDYLYDKNNGDLYATIRNYRGKNDINLYVAKIDSYLSNNNKSVKQLSYELKRE